ncbi:hypothetical protein E2C01_084448 [Portunus trituberculatus]|uniref:Uncharacterized protein n=1 Tax=Portunus trituberculatus TaxID=210409 RepID=A0A5B7J7J3_PORTR|nr:hypothetical protein [Portunus trituberculatus]
MGPCESNFGTVAGLHETVMWRIHETVTWRGGGEVANEVASGGGEGSGVCYWRAVTTDLQQPTLANSSHVMIKITL